jgi:hypothetical protein
MESPAPDPSPRPNARALQPGWADKSVEVFKRKPLYRRRWFVRLVVILALLGLGGGGVVGLYLYRWHRQQQAELDGQRRSVEAFVRSPSFESFAREADAQLVAALNFVTLRPDIAGGLLPDIAAAEKAGHQVPWALEISPLPVSTANHPARVRMSVLTATGLLAERGFVFDQPRMAEARRILLRLLTPHARVFLAENTGSSFPALFLDRRMQEIVVDAYAARAGGTPEETEKAFIFYSLVGPALWKEIDGKTAPGALGR